jgi:flavin reductase (DIM6/NTAB) family NADH-FMN oxidoreductase RutF
MSISMTPLFLPASQKDETVGVDGVKFLDAMASICTSVAVVTATSGDVPYGTTVGAFGSLSREPPLVFVSLSISSQLLEVAHQTHRIGINVLAAGQESLALAFAQKGSNKFDGVAWRLDRKLPRLDGGCVWMVCTIDELVRHGDHELVIGHVHLAEVKASLKPLTFYQREFGTHSSRADTLRELDPLRKGEIE